YTLVFVLLSLSTARFHVAAPATPAIYTLSLHDALPILRSLRDLTQHLTTRADDNHAPPVTDAPKRSPISRAVIGMSRLGKVLRVDRKSTRLNSSHVSISYAVFCLKKKRKQQIMIKRVDK